MNRKHMFAILLALLAVRSSPANVGIYYGSGHTLKLTSTSKVQLVFEDVTIEAEPYFRSPAMIGRVLYRGQYVLRNNSSEPVCMTVGFPIDSGTMSEQLRALRTPEQLTSFVVDLGFIVRDEHQTYHVELGGDGLLPHRHVFHWEMSLEPGEARTVYVSYRFPISHAAASTRREPDEDRASMSKLEKAFDGAIHVWFGYITETGASWAGPIERARFSVEFKDFKETLSNKTFAETLEAPGEESYKANWNRKPRVFVKTSPDGFTSRTNDSVEWYAAPYEPDEPIQVNFWLTWIPDHPDHLRPFLEAFYQTPTPAREEFVELREVLLCSLGKPAQTKNVAAIVNRYVWYEPKKDFDEKLLSKSQREMLRLLDEMIAEAK